MNDGSGSVRSLPQSSRESLSFLDVLSGTPQFRIPVTQGSFIPEVSLTSGQSFFAWTDSAKLRLQQELVIETIPKYDWQASLYQVQAASSRRTKVMLKNRSRTPALRR